MKSWIFGLLLLMASVSWGQEGENATPTDISQAPLVSSAGKPKLADSRSEEIFSIPLPFKVAGCAASTSEDALFVWGANEDSGNKLILLSLESGKILAETITQRVIHRAYMNSTHVYLRVASSSDSFIQLERENLRETDRTLESRGELEVINEHLLYDRQYDSCFLLPDLKRFTFFSQSDTRINRLQSDTKLGNCASGFSCCDIFWTHDLKPKYLIGPSIFTSLKRDVISQINCELISSGHVLFSRLPAPSNFVHNLRMRPALLKDDQQLSFCDPYSYETIKSYKNLPGTLAAHTSRYVFVLHEGNINLIPVPEIPEPISLEPLNTTWTISHKGPTKFSFRLKGATHYRLELTGLPTGVESLNLTSQTGDFEVDVHKLLPNIYTSLSQTNEKRNYRLELDGATPFFEALVGTKPKGFPFVVQINVAALTSDLQYRVFKQYCFLELPLSKIQNILVGRLIDTERVWTDKNGQSFRGKLTKAMDNEISIRRESSSTSTPIPIKDFSEFDRVWIGDSDFEPAIP